MLQQQRRDDEERHHRAGGAGGDVHRVADVGQVVVADRDDLAGGHPLGQRRAEADGLPGDELDDAVGRGQPVGDREPVPHDRGDRADHPDART